MHSRVERLKFWMLVLKETGNLFPTQWRTEFLDEWARYENTGAQHNPLATTRSGLEDATNPYWNDNRGNPVRNYGYLEAGAKKTAETLNLSYYKNVVAALTFQDSKYLKQAGAEIKNSWGTVHFGQALIDGWTPDGASTVPEKVYEPLVFSRMPVNGTIGGRYWQTTGYWTPANPHAGVDIGGPPWPIYREPVYCPARGKVDGVFRNTKPGELHYTFGKFIILDHMKTEYFSGYAHLDEIVVEAGQFLEVGDLMGYVGFSGLVDPPNQDGSHLHWQVSKEREFPKSRSVTADPLSFLDLTPELPATPPQSSEFRMSRLERVLAGWGAWVKVNPENRAILEKITGNSLTNVTSLHIVGEDALRYLDTSQISLFGAHANLNEAAVLLQAIVTSLTRSENSLTELELAEILEDIAKRLRNG